MPTDLRVTELDFNNIRANLKAFLQSQEQFSDYNFDGSALSVLLDTLAYNTHYNAILAHLSANEQFLDTAIKRSSVVSLAKTLGYIPQSTKSATVLVNLTVTPSGSPPSTLTLPTSTLFTSSINGTTFNFSVKTAQTVSLSQGVYQFNDVELIEGARLPLTYTVQPDTTAGPFVIPNQTVDLSTVTVTVKESANTTDITTFTKVTSVLDAGPTSKIFWIEELPSGNYAVIFGDDVLGQSLSIGNVVNISFISSSGSAANNAKQFVLSGDIGGYTNVVITNVSSGGAFGGAERESIDSIRFHAPKFNAARDRVVTSQDYQTLITTQYPAVKSVAVWGGEENDPPIYGKVFISLEPLDNQIITQDIKNHIANTIIKPRSVVSIQPEFVDPEYLYITLKVSTIYDSTATTSTAAQIAGFVSTSVTDYFATQLNKLDATFYYSQLITAIDGTTASIVGSLVEMGLQKRILGLTTGSAETLNYNGALIPNTISSNYFRTVVNGTQYVAYLRDIPNDNSPVTTGQGTIGLFARETDLLLDPNYGTIDYGIGKIVLPNIVVNGYIGTVSDVRIRATPQESAKNVTSQINSTTSESETAVFPLASKNTIITLDDSPADSAAGITAGLTVTAIPTPGKK